MFQRILVPTDFSEKSLAALDVAVQLAAYDAREITLLHVIETIDDADFEEFSGFFEKLKERASDNLNKMADTHRDKGIAIGKEIVFGKRVVEIVKYANENNMDLIVLGSHKIDLADSFKGWGTISYRVGILAPCPILMIK